MNTIVVASGNAGKIREIQHALADFPVKLIPQTELAIAEIAEDGLSFVENALLKARNAARHSALPAIADDSGIVVPTLQGAPGIYSARYAGPNASDAQNVQKLLQAMQDQTGSARRAFFYCALVYVQHADDPMPLIGLGKWQGEIAGQAVGSGGFGYDPVFYLPELRCTAAELTTEHKKSLSHRGQALKAFVSQYRDVYGV